jgi:hypothetical protein
MWHLTMNDRPFIDKMRKQEKWAGGVEVVQVVRLGKRGKLEKVENCVWHPLASYEQPLLYWC